MPETTTALGVDTLALLTKHGTQFASLCDHWPNVKHSFVFRDGEILGRFENEDGIVSFYPNGAFFGHNTENWG